MDGPILLEDFRDIAANLVSEGRMPDERLWVDDFREVVANARTTALLDGLV